MTISRSTLPFDLLRKGMETDLIEIVPWRLQTAIPLVISFSDSKPQHQVRLYSRLIDQLFCSLHPSRWNPVLKVFTRCRSLALNRIGEREILRQQTQLYKSSSLIPSNMFMI
jgi:hypothetical protein